MDARELRIDNFVGYEHDFVKVVEASEEYTTIIYKDGYVDEVKTDQLYPINLTDEILEKSGWTKMDDKSWKYNDKGLGVTFTIEKYTNDGKMLLGIMYNALAGNTMQITYVESVHELQNAMWGLKAKCEIEL